MTSPFYYKTNIFTFIAVKQNRANKPAIHSNKNVMNRLILVLLLITVFDKLYAQCPITPSGVVTNVACNGGNNGAIDVTVTSGSTGNPTGYCLPLYSQPCGNCSITWDMIWNFSTSGGSTNISNLQSGCNGTLPNNYSYVNQTVSINPGQSFNIQVQCGQSGMGCFTTFAQGFRVWVDWNADGDFYDAGENVWNSGTASTQMFYGTITCPVNTTCGMKRMRVRSTYSMVPSDPCSSLTYGETEDYNVMVGSQTTFLWSNGATTEDISNLTAGTYTVTITNGGQSQTLNFTVNEPPPVTATVTTSGPTTFCQGGSVILNAPVGTGFTYHWSDGSTGSSLTATQSGLYSVTVTAGVGCSATGSQQVQVIPAPSPSIISPSDTVLLCQGATVQLSATPSNNITWQPGGQTTASITVSSNGTYTVVTTNANGCSSQSLPVVVTVVPPPSPSINASGALTFCQGGSVTLTSNYPSGNIWSNGATTSSITVTSSGNYTVTVTATGGCSGVSAVTTVTVNPLPNPAITAGGPTTFCQGGSVTLSSNSTTGNTWSNSQNTSSITVTTTGSYSLTVTDANGCSATTGPTNVTVNALPTAPVITPNGPTTICSGNNVTLTSNYTTGNVWSNNQIGSSITVTTAGNYSITYTDANGCTAVSATVAITVNPTPSSTFTATSSICIVDNATITYTGNATAGATYNWNFGGGTIISGSGQGPYSIHFNNAGTYTVTLTVTENNCTSTLTSNNIVVSQTPDAPFTASALAVCQGQTLVFTYTGGASAAATYNWQPGTGAIIGGSGQGPITVQFDQAGTTSVGLTVTQGSCVSQLYEVSVQVNPLPSPNIINDFSSACDSLTVLFTTPGNAVTYNWNLGNGTIANTPTAITTYYSGCYDVTLSMIDANGCFNTYTAIGLINVAPTPIASFVTSPKFEDSLDIETGSITFNNTSSNATIYKWSFGDGSNSTATSPTHTYAMPGLYTVQLIATNYLGCSDTISKGPFLITPAASTFIPNTFSPNKDGRNDVFRIYSTRVVEMRLIVFDRIGEKLFESTDINQGWDGTLHGKLMNVGVYVYYCKVKYDSGRYEELFGDITLIR